MKILIDKTLYVVGFFSIILFGVFIFGVFMLTGCESDGVVTSKCGGNGEWISTTVTPSSEGYCKYDNYLTEEEVRDLVDSLIESSEYKIYVDVDFEMNKLEDELWETNKKVNRINERVLELESELRDFERFEYEDLIEFMDYFDDDDLFLKELNEYLNKEYMMFTEDLWTEFIIEYGGILHNTYQTQIDELEERIEILEGE